MKLPWQQASSTKDGRPFWTVFSGFALDSLDIQIYAFVLPVLLAVWGLSPTEAGLLATVTLVSSALGGWIAGYLADRYGRVRLMKFTILWFAVATCLCGLTNSYEQLIVARIFQGLGFGGELAVGALFLGEVASAKYRARMVGMAQSGWALGWAAAVIFSIFVLSRYPAESGWRVLFVVGVIPAIPVYIFRSKLKEPEVFRTPTSSPSWKAIFSGAELGFTLKGCLLAIGVHGGYWAIATWWPTMLLAERGLKLTSSGPYLAALIAGSFFGYAVGSYLGDKIGRRITLVIFALSGIVVVLTFSQLAVSNKPFIFLSLLLGFVATGMYGIIGSILMEQYPTELRGAGLGFCYNVGRGGAGFAPAIIGSWVALLGVGHAIALFVGCAYGLVLLAAILLPETQGRELISRSGPDTDSPHRSVPS